jgi:hypothetical protein
MRCEVASAYDLMSALVAMYANEVQNANFAHVYTLLCTNNFVATDTVVIEMPSRSDRVPFHCRCLAAADTTFVSG